MTPPRLRSTKPAPPPIKETANGDLVYLCPFCEDRSGHLQVHPQKNLYHCWRCGASGRVPKLVRLTGIDYPYDPDTPSQERATDIASFLFDQPPQKTKEAVDYRALCRAPRRISPKAAGVAGLGRLPFLLPLSRVDGAWSDYSLPLPQGPWSLAIEAYRYLRSRGVTHGLMVDWEMAVCTDPDARGYVGRVVFPAYCPSTGKFRGFQARAIPRFGSKDKRPRYLSPKRNAQPFPLLYTPQAHGLAGLRCLDTVVLVEGPMDALALSSPGVDIPAAALMGKVLKPGAVSELKLSGVQRAIIMLDADASRGSILRLVGELQQGGMPAAVAALQEGDPGEQSAGALRQAVENALPGKAYFGSQLLAQ